MLSSNQIHDISAGRALDVLAMEIIFEWGSVNQWDHLDEKTGEMVVDDDDWFGVPPNALAEFFEGKRKASIEPIPYISTKFECAEKIISYLVKLGYDFKLQSLLPITKYDKNKNFKWLAIFYDFGDMEPCISNGVGYVNHIIGDINDEYQWGGKAETIPLAITRAGLMAIVSRKIKQQQIEETNS